METMLLRFHSELLSDVEPAGGLPVAMAVPGPPPGPPPGPLPSSKPPPLLLINSS